MEPSGSAGTRYAGGMLSSALRARRFDPDALDRRDPRVVRTLLPVFEEARARGIPVVVTSQAHRNGVDLSLYAAGGRARELGALSGGDMTTEACVVKLMHALAYAKNLAGVRQIFERDLAGERSA